MGPKKGRFLTDAPVVDPFEKHEYKVSDVTNAEFVGIRITHDEQYNYCMDPTRMIDVILVETQMMQAKDVRLPYPLQGVRTWPVYR